MGFAGHAIGLRALLPRLQHNAQRTLWKDAPYPQSVQWRGERLLPLRSRKIWLRLRQSLLRKDGSAEPEPTTKAEVLRHLTGLLSSHKAIGIGSPRASLEANFALRELVGAERFHLGLSASEQELFARIIDILQRGPARAAS